MTFIKTILDTEEKAREMSASAHDEAKKMTLAAQEAQKKETEESLISLKEARASQIAEQKKKLAELYKETLTKGQKDIDRIGNRAGSNHEKAVLEVLKAITS